MTKRLACKQLGVIGCDFSASGESAGDIVRQVVEHLRAEHDMDMPDPEIILEGETMEDPLDMVEPGSALVVQRLKEALNIVQPKNPKISRPPLGNEFPR